MVWILIALVITASLVSDNFLEPDNIKNLLSQNAPIGIVAVGMTFVILAGGFDLSVGAIYAMGALVFAKTGNSLPNPLAALITLLAGAGFGAINGAIVTRMKVNPFVATLGTGSAFGGLAILYANSSPILNDKPGFGSLGNNEFLGIPLTIFVLIGFLLIGGFLLAKTVYGRGLYAVGGNTEAARLSGSRTDLLRGSTYAISGLCAAVGGMIIASRLGLGQPEVSPEVALDAIAIVIIGGTSLLGGEGAIWRTTVGLLILATLTNLFDVLALEAAAQMIVKGVVVVGAVGIDSLARRRA
jgi:ribose transport system permease protein